SRRQGRDDWPYRRTPPIRECRPECAGGVRAIHPSESQNRDVQASLRGVACCRSLRREVECPPATDRQCFRRGEEMGRRGTGRRLLLWASSFHSSGTMILPRAKKGPSWQGTSSEPVTS